MLRISGLTLARGTRPLLDGADLAVHAGHKVGLIGANGSGKSSLFAAIRGELIPDAGTIELPPRWIVADVAQESPALAKPAIEFVLDGDKELREIESALAVAGAGPHDATQVGHELADLHHRYEAIGGYEARSRAATLLAGLGFSDARQREAVAHFSGGWRMRLALAQALMCRSDLLLLDEPTNHLDLDAVLWLEDWLSRYPGTLLLITHDRDFLDAVADTIVHIDARKLVTYAGNYSAFEVKRALELARSQAVYAKQQRTVAHLRAFVDRFRAKATKAKQVQSRIKALERMELIAPAHADSPFEFTFADAGESARQLVRLEHATLAYDERVVLSGVDWAVLSGARIGLLGANGMGKSTLLKALAGVLAPSAGERHAAQTLRVGYLAQHQIEQLREDQSPLWHLKRTEPDTREQALRDFLGGFDIRGDMATSAVGRFSGGEKTRLALALIVRSRPNLLLLDEPTNHLDLEMREALTEALQEYRGALVVVAHDRHLLRATADELWLVADGKVAPFEGDLDDYRDWVLRGQMDATPVARTTESSSDSRKARKRVEAQARQRRADERKPLVARQTRVEAEMKTLADEKKTLDQWLASEAAYAPESRDALATALARAGELTFMLARLESDWLEIAEALEKITS
jgi:ATP-binding cassette subfamily F protein 3